MKDMTTNSLSSRSVHLLPLVSIEWSSVSLEQLVSHWRRITETTEPVALTNRTQCFANHERQEQTRVASIRVCLSKTPGANDSSDGSVLLMVSLEYTHMGNARAATNRFVRYENEDAHPR